MKELAKRTIKAELARKGITYPALAELMRKKGYNENEDSIRTKINRGSFSFAFVLEVCDALDMEINFIGATSPSVPH